MLSLGAFRNRVFVSRHIQGRLMLRVGLYWVLYHVVLWHGLLVYHYAQSRISGATATPPPPPPPVSAAPGRPSYCQGKGAFRVDADGIERPRPECL